MPEYDPAAKCMSFRARQMGNTWSFQFDSQFERKRVAVETVTPMRDTDGSWRVSGYLIR